MPIAIKEAELENLIKSFYTLSHIKIVVIDDNFNEILAYPKNHTDFCALMHGNEFTHSRCYSSTRDLCKKAKERGGLVIEKCHAGLTEAVMPIRDNGVVIGYMMFGQISDVKENDKKFSLVLKQCEDYPQSAKDIKDSLASTRHRTNSQISAAAEIMTACTNYIMLKQMVRLNEKQFFSRMTNYIDEHLNEDLSIPHLSAALNTSKTRLYELCKQYTDGKIAAYIRSRRLKKASELLKDTEISISTISEMVGFSDYNYFCRIFKRYMGTSAKSYRKQYRKTQNEE